MGSKGEKTRLCMFTLILIGVPFPVQEIQRRSKQVKIQTRKPRYLKASISLRLLSVCRPHFAK